MALIPLTVWGMQKVLEFRSGASPELKPQEVRVTDLTNTSVTISWVTPDVETEGYIIFGTGSDLDRFTRDLRDIQAGSLNKYTTHYVVLENLTPQTTYYFELVSGSTKFSDVDGNPFSFLTLSTDDVGWASPHPVMGTILNGQNASAIVYLNLENDGILSNVLSALTNTDGSWEIDLSRARTEDGKASFTYTNDTKMTIVAMGGSLGGGSVLAKVSSPIQDLDITMTSGFETKDLLADSSQIDTGDDGQTTDDTGGTGGDDTGDDTGTGDTSSGNLADEARYAQVVWTDLNSDIALEAPSEVAGVTATTGEESVKITNVTDVSFTVTWFMTEEVVGLVHYSLDSNDLSEIAYDDRDDIASQDTYYAHHVSISDLDAGEIYYFEVISGDETFLDNDEPFLVQLYEMQDNPPSLIPISGTVSGNLSSDALIFVTITDEDGSAGTSTELSTVVGESGSWTIPSINEAYISDGSAYFQATSEDTIEVLALTYGGGDIVENTVEESETETIALQMSSMGGTGGNSIPANGMRDLSEMGSGTPKTGFFKEQVRIILSAIGIIVFGILLSPRKMFNFWEQKIIQKIRT